MLTKEYLVGHSKSEKEYDKLAKVYDNKWNKYLRVTHLNAIRVLNPKKGDKILDASGGSGLLAFRVIRSINGIKKFTVVDNSSGMLNIAKGRLSQFNNVDIIKSDIHDIPIQNESFDKVISTSSFHFYKYPSKAIFEFKRILRQNGEITILDWSKSPFYFKIYDYFKRIFDSSHKRSYTSKEIVYMLKKQGFKINKVRQWSFKFWPFYTIHAKKM